MKWESIDERTDHRKKTGKKIGVFPIILGGTLGKSETEFFNKGYRKDSFVNE